MKYFGTDGVRGRANESLTIEMALAIGKYIGYYFRERGNRKIVIGRDSRLSSKMFEHALASGISSSGCDVFLLGLCATPCVAHLIQREKFSCGAMISASHNPFYDNGIKLFNHEGKKMDENVLELIESYMDGKLAIEPIFDDKIGRIVDFSEGVVLYESWLKEIINCDFSSLKIVVDLANGSACRSVLHVLRDLHANIKVIHNSPSGLNINANCGSTHMESLINVMKNGDYDIGLAFDGDADRLLCVNSSGEVVDGDIYMFVVAKYLNRHQLLANQTLVTTVMSNIGLYKALDKLNLHYEQTKVGDKYVYECMEKYGYNFGGEQSGHIIFRDFANTGDGLLSALFLLKIMCEEQKSLEELQQGITIYPQLLKNIRVRDKKVVTEDETLQQLISQIAKDLNEDGRILVRESGTEPLIRVMVEAISQEICEEKVNLVIDYIKNKGY